jgi:predicted chitinase
MDAYNTISGGSIQIAQEDVDGINDVTSGYTLYRQLAYIAQTMWESGGYRFTEELAAINPPFANREAYQDCDWNAEGIQAPTNGKVFYGRGYMQLSWCANYRAYGQNRMVNNDPDYFYNNPELVATTYKWDSAAWFFEETVPDETGQFGLTTMSINGVLECGNTGSETPAKRFQIFDAIARHVGMTGYSADGC